jgi:coenzyme F420-reducing hydrogenase gamma subunit
MIGNRTYANCQYDNIIRDQVTISYLSKSIDFDSTDYMCPYDRKLVLSTLMEIKEKEAELRSGNDPTRRHKSTRY